MKTLSKRSRPERLGGYALLFDGEEPEAVQRWGSLASIFAPVALSRLALCHQEIMTEALSKASPGPWIRPLQSGFS